MKGERHLMMIEISIPSRPGRRQSGALITQVIDKNPALRTSYEGSSCLEMVPMKNMATDAALARVERTLARFNFELLKRYGLMHEDPEDPEDEFETVVTEKNMYGSSTEKAQDQIRMQIR
ncbi:hypothetical protein GGX14DRAFT_562643 [Mycena pura]|uniref:Uncharacterized protein n=1 Tax=Mycena pura TaxID=153505 RepID=A0AAD6YJI2_9AGAR|nr:hypothetical protein GGX14DRAFT_562643 [Mycena pura]